MSKNSITLLLSVFLLSGCGYAIQKTLPIESVGIGMIENLSSEPKIGDRLIEILSLQLMKNGIRVDGGSAHSITGRIESFTLRGLSEKEGITVSYEVIIKGRFFLNDAKGEARELRNRGNFIITFSGEGPLEGVMARKEEAIERALADMASEIAASIVYGT